MPRPPEHIQPTERDRPLEIACATDVLSQIPKMKGVKARVFGHTHYSTKFKKQGILFVSNQRGYVFPCSGFIGPNNHFNVKKVIYV